MRPSDALLAHRDDEGELRILPDASGFALEVRRPGLREEFRMHVESAALFGWCHAVLEALDSDRRVAAVQGPSVGTMNLSALVAPSESREALLVMLTRAGRKGDHEGAVEMVRFRDREQMGTFMESVLELGGATTP